MTPEEQRIFIAEMCGWKCRTQEIEHTIGYRWTEKIIIWTDPEGTDNYLPNFPTDLNAIRDAWVECIQGNDELEDRYSIELLRAVGSEDPADGARPSRGDSTWALVSNATAAQRAQALINVKNNY